MGPSVPRSPPSPPHARRAPAAVAVMPTGARPLLVTHTRPTPIRWAHRRANKTGPIPRRGGGAVPRGTGTRRGESLTFTGGGGGRVAGVGGVAAAVEPQGPRRLPRSILAGAGCVSGRVPESLAWRRGGSRPAGGGGLGRAWGGGEAAAAPPPRSAGLHSVDLHPPACLTPNTSRTTRGETPAVDPAQNFPGSGGREPKQPQSYLLPTPVRGVPTLESLIPEQEGQSIETSGPQYATGVGGLLRAPRGCAPLTQSGPRAPWATPPQPDCAHIQTPTRPRPASDLPELTLGALPTHRQ